MSSPDGIGPPAKPNIVVVLCDQLRAFETGCYGNDVVRTPHIDGLAAEGVRFATAVSNNPVCMPARSCLLSGQYSRTCQGFLGNHAERLADGTSAMPEYPEDRRRFLVDPTLPEQLKAVGYETTWIGKWHVQPSPPKVGFDYSLYPRVHHRHTGQVYVENDPPARTHPEGFEGDMPEGFSVDYEARAVREYLDTAGNRPFFLTWSISPPHMPLDDGPEEFLRMYRAGDVPLRDNVWQPGEDGRRELPFDEHWFKIYLWDFLYYQERLPHTEQLPPGFTLRHLIARYYGMTTWVDAQVGRLREALRANGLDRDTIVVFLADHGDNLGSHGLFNKGRLIEESIRIPLLWWCPSRWQSRVCDAGVASIVDVMPTLLELAGARVPDSVQGTSLVPAILGEGAAPAQAYVETTGGEIGVRTQTHLYGMQLDEARREIADPEGCFYDLAEDPFETTNLAGTDRQADVAADLRARLEGWHGETPKRLSRAC